jgi:hypothetical protein
MKIDILKMHSVGFGIVFFPKYGWGLHLGQRWFGIKNAPRSKN